MSSGKKARRSVKLDRVQASDLRQYNLIYACEQCTYFNEDHKNCVLGFPSLPHQEKTQMKTFETQGHMALCRFLEID